MNNSQAAAVADPRGNRLFPSRWNRLYWMLTKLRQEYELAVKEHWVQSGGRCIVDYGCGNMPYKSLFKAERYVGLDFEGNAFADTYLENNGRIPLENDYCEGLLSSQVLEHVENVPFYLQECQRVLKPGGLIFLSTHGHWKYHPDPQDYWRWTCKGLRKILEEAGFELLSFRGIMGLEAAALQLWQDAAGKRVNYRIRPLFYRYMQWRIERADRGITEEIRNRDACIYVAVGRCIKS